MRPDHLKAVNLDVCSECMHHKFDHLSQDGKAYFRCDKHDFELTEYERYECKCDDFDCRWK